MTDIVGNVTIRDWWEERAVTHAERTFLIYQDKEGETCEYTYRTFNEEIDRTANLFLERGIGKGENVAVQMHTSPEFMMCLFALAKIGAVLVPMNDQYLQEECEYVLEKCAIVAAVISEEFVDLYDAIRADGYEFSKGLLRIASGRVSDGAESSDDFTALKDVQPSKLREVRPLSSDDLVEILFTSGTTSRPKGVELTHANLVFSGIYGAWETALDEDDRLLSTMPACHSNFQLAALTPVLYVGATLVAIEKYSARKFWQQVRHFRATVTQCVAMMLRTLMLQPIDENEQDHCLREVLYFLPLTDEEKIAFEERFAARIMNTYGSTESLVWVLTDLPHGSRKWPSVGRVGLSYQVKIVDDEGNELPAGEVGEIVIKGEPGRTLMRGYHRDPEETAKAFDEHGWMHTGDKGSRDEEGWFYFFDRKTNLIKRAGENISTIELENILVAHPRIAEAAVIGVPDPIRDQAVKAFVLPVEGATITVQEVLDYCAEHMAAFKVPTYVEIRSDFPRTCSMKIEKKLLN